MIDIDFDLTRNNIIQVNRDEAEDLYWEIRTMYEQGDSFYDIYEILNEYQMKHLESAAKKLCVSKEEALQAIIDGPVELAILILVKDSSRTGYQERLQYESLRDQSTSCIDWAAMPKKGKNACGLNNGNIVSMSNSLTKSIDFSATDAENDYDIIVAAKYTNEEGGAQDNQARDLEEFARQAPPRGSSTIVVLIADGAYYLKQRNGYGGQDFFDYIRNVYADLNVFATTTEYFDENLEDFLSSLYE